MTIRLKCKQRYPKTLDLLLAHHNLKLLFDKGLRVIEGNELAFNMLL